MNEETKETKEVRSSAVAVRRRNERNERSPFECRWSGRHAKPRTILDAGRLHVLHRRDRAIQGLGRWARTPAQHRIFRPMILEDWKPVKIALQDCVTW